MNTIRRAKPADADALLSIYAPYIAGSAFTFETEVPSTAAFAKRIEVYQENWPWLIFEIDGIIAGYAYATKHRERTAYQWCVESSVYVNDDYQKRGIAKALYTALFSILKYQGCRNVYAGITLPNDKSISFHKKYGFMWIADYKNIGYKLSKWHTVSWWQMQLNDYSNEPEAPLKFPQVDATFLESILNKY
jgi:phosphinothricin acetyltransferase